MKFLLAALLSASLAAAKNGFISPKANATIYAGTNVLLSWNNTDGGDSVDLTLLQGKADDLSTVFIIASDLSNSGAVEWAAPSTISSGSDYAIRIHDTSDSNSDDDNYTGFITIVNNSTTTSTTSTSTPATSSSSSTPLFTSTNTTSATATSLGFNSTTAQTTLTGSGSATASASASGSASGSGSASRSATSSSSSSAGGAAEVLANGALAAVVGGLVMLL